MNRFFFFNLLIIVSVKGICQDIKTCGSDELFQNWLKEHPVKFQESVKSITNPSNIQALTTYTIPVVFHILHQYGTENISDAQVIDQVNILNRDYKKLNADTVNVYAPFVPADSHFEFRLATKDTNGNCTSGIIHHYDANTNWQYPAFPSQYNYTWNSTRYLNIYVVKSITGFGSGGYSSFPGTNSNAMDVVVLMNNSVGSIGTSSIFRSRLLTHEVGHWFNLQHPWAFGGTLSSVCGDDGVTDTPITKGFTNCPANSTLSAICNPPSPENFQNYMDYSFCTCMFSAGQVARMTAAINSTVSGRNNLWSNVNLIATGVVNPVGPCALIPDFYNASNSYTVCSGQSITFLDATSNGTVTSRQWSATGSATLSSNSASNTIVTFSTHGTQTVNLLVTNSAGSSITSHTVLVLSDTANINYNYPESFENAGLPQDFSIINIDNDVTWAQTSLAASTGTNSYYIEGASDAPNSNPDILETPSYDFASDPNATFTFKYAYAKYNSSNLDVFKVQASKDCGGSWQDIWVPSNSAMASGSGGVSTVPFIPAVSQFKTYTLTNHPNFSPFLSDPNVRIRFFFKEDANAGYGNNIFLDDINFNSNVSAINELANTYGVTLFPNPTEGKANLTFVLSEYSVVSYFITDITGRVVDSESDLKLSQGRNNIALDEKQVLNKGLYFLNLRINKNKIVKRLYIE